MTVNCEQLRPEDILEILENLLYEFPLCRIDFYLPRWVDTLEDTHPSGGHGSELEEIMKPMRRIRDVYKEAVQLSNPYVKETRLEKISLDKGSASVHVELKEACYYEMLSQMTGMKIQSEYQLISMIRELSGKRKSYEKVEKAVEAVPAARIWGDYSGTVGNYPGRTCRNPSGKQIWSPDTGRQPFCTYDPCGDCDRNRAYCGK